MKPPPMIVMIVIGVFVGLVAGSVAGNLLLDAEKRRTNAAIEKALPDRSEYSVETERRGACFEAAIQRVKSGKDVPLEEFQACAKKEGQK